MSLKAKIEAVIYASEEPVTLAQMVGLLGVEGQAELDRLADRQGSLGLDGDGAEPVPETEGSLAAVQTGDQGEAKGDGEVDAGETTSQSEDGGSSVSEACEKKISRERERKLREFFREILDELMRDYATGDRGLEVREVAGGFRMATKPEYHDAVRGFVRVLKPVLKLSLQALETLAVVAYKQPVTAPEVSEIRGVDSGGVLGSLMGRKLITTAGRKQVIGRPILYKTTKDFLLRFGLKDIGELPSIEEFEKLAGEMAEQEEIPMPQGSDTQEERVTTAELQEERAAVEPQADGDSEDLDEVVPVDGRMTVLDPNYDKPGDDPSADEAAIQEQEKEESR